MKKKALAVQIGDNKVPVRFMHWWPGRPGTAHRLTSLILLLEGKTPKYGTWAIVDAGFARFEERALCCQKDQPTREAGRFIALLRLARSLRRFGLQIERA